MIFMMKTLETLALKGKMRIAEFFLKRPHMHGKYEFFTTVPLFVLSRKSYTRDISFVHFEDC